MLTFYRRVIGRGTFTTISGKAFRPRPMDMGRMAWVLFSVCLLYVMLAVVLPIAALVFTSLQRFATVILSQAAVHPRQLPDRAVARPGAHRHGQQPDAGLRRGELSACW